MVRIRLRSLSVRRASYWQQLLVPGTTLQPRFGRLGIFWVLLTLLVVLLARLFELQVVQGAYHRQRADENRVITHRLAAARGIVTDRNGVVLVQNVPSYKRLTADVPVTAGQFEPISREEALSLVVGSDQLVFFDIYRDYLFGRAAAPVLGYVGEVGADDLGDASYVVGDLTGKAGIERTFEQRLRGVAGLEFLEVTAGGVLVRSLGEDQPTAGSSMKLTIDVGLQQRLYQAMEEYAGGAVATDPETGEILALVSVPSFDPNNVSGSLAEPDQPFFNRVVSGAYPPGSVFKIITAVAGLEEGKITGETMIEDTGEIRVNDYRFGNWYFDQYGKTEGSVDLVKALQRSNDIYFYRVGEWVGPEALASWARLFGFGEVTGILLPGEVAGLVPSPAFRERYLGSRWFLGNTYHFAIGQGDLTVTPLQMNAAMAVIANGGRLCRPVLVEDEKTGERACQELGVSLGTIRLVTDGLIRACERGGTAFPFFDFSPKVACKTGTAQFGDPEGRTHAWFSVFAPAEDPEIVLTVLLEKAGEGSYKAAPVAKAALEYWFRERNKE